MYESFLLTISSVNRIHRRVKLREKIIKKFTDETLERKRNECRHSPIHHHQHPWPFPLPVSRVSLIFSLPSARLFCSFTCIYDTHTHTQKKKIRNKYTHFKPDGLVCSATRDFRRQRHMHDDHHLVRVILRYSSFMRFMLAVIEIEYQRGNSTNYGRHENDKSINHLGINGQRFHQ